MSYSEDSSMNILENSDMIYLIYIFIYEAVINKGANSTYQCDVIRKKGISDHCIFADYGWLIGT